MQEKFLLSYYIRYSIACALAYCIPVYIFFKHEEFSQFWLLYLGNSLYACLMLISGLFVNKKLHNSASLRALIVPGIKVIFSSIIIVCLLVGILAVIFRHNIVQQAPTNYNGLFYALSVNAVLVNFIVGMLLIFIGAVTIKRNQRNEKGEEIT